MPKQDEPTAYADIINLPHPFSERHARMSMAERAAQFSPFAALSGYGETIRETARLTDSRPELDEDRKEELNFRLQRLLDAEEPPAVRLFVFVPDEHKQGGAIVERTGTLLRFDPITGELVLSSGERIAIEDLMGIGE